MVTNCQSGYISLVPLDIQEFFNENHSSEDGRFTSGPGGGGGGKGDAKLEEKRVTKKYDADAKKSAAIGKRRRGNDVLKEEEVNWAATAITAVGIVVYLELVGIPVTSLATSQTIGRYHAQRAAAKLAGAPVSKGIYTIRGQNGKTLKLVNHSDKLTGKQRDSLLNGLQKTYDNDPIPGKPPYLNVWEKNEASPDADGFFYMQPGRRDININRGVLFDEQRSNAIMGSMPNGGRNYFMTSHKKDPSRYTVAHEYGHMKDNYQMDEANAAIATGRAKPPLVGRYETNHDADRAEIWDDDSLRADYKGGFGFKTNGRSSYSRQNQYEGYAESYAEWSVTDGKTTNKASTAYAQTFNWEIYKSSAIPVGPVTGPGIRIVRTPEGAKLYGVAIGQRIPKAETAATGTITLSLGKS